MGRMDLPLSPWSAGALGAAFVMWMVMMALMMLPSVAPMIAALARASRQSVAEGQEATPPWAFIAGYLAVWAAFSAMAAILQSVLRSWAFLSPQLVTTRGVIASGLLLVAGVYQLSPFKSACLSHCRVPLGLLLHRERHGARGAIAMGVEYGVSCVGCCWALMLVLFAVGVMNIYWVIALAALIAVEKLAPGGAWVGRAAGVALIAWGIATIVTSH